MKLSKKQILPLAVVGLVLIGLVAWLAIAEHNIADEVVIEAGSMPLASDYLIRNLGIEAEFVTDLSEYDLTCPGVYDVQVRYDGKVYDASLRVRDTVAPTAEVQDLTSFAAQPPEPEDFLTAIRDVTAVTVTYKQEPDMTREGAQTVVLLLTDAGGNVTELEAALTVIQDSTAPEIEGVQELRHYLGQEVDYCSGVTVTDDLDPDPALTVDDSRVDLTVPGTYELVYIGEDASGNRSEVTTTVAIIDDTTPPVLYGATDRTLCVGSTIAYRSGVLVTDDTDPSPKLSIDSSQVDLSTPGTYPLVYTAADKAGNVTTLEVTVTVHEKVYYYVDESIIYEKADEIIAEIITEDMTAEDQVWAIYRWIRANYTFNGWADKIDWKQSAYNMIVTGRGDCYNFFALSKLLFERLGIPNVDVQRVRTWEHEGNHYWSVVSVDGGETWYHYDSTPFQTPDEMCLVTDEALDEFSAKYWNCYNRDRSTYPATP